MGLTDEHNDPAFRYESLARESFNNCKKWGDPWGYAAQDFYNEFVHEPTTVRGKRALNTILAQLILKFQGSDIEESLKQQETLIDNLNTQREVIGLVDSTIQIIRSKD